MLSSAGMQGAGEEAEPRGGDPHKDIQAGEGEDGRDE